MDGLESIKYEAVKFWNSLSDSMRTMTLRLQESQKEHKRTFSILITFIYFK